MEKVEYLKRKGASSASGHPEILKNRPVFGNFCPEAPFVLAPMAGYTDLACRRLARRMGAGWVVTELTSVEGLIRHSAPTLQMLDTHPEEAPCVAHLYGHDPAHFGEAAAMVEAMGKFVAIDLNAGCPVPKIVRRGAGAGLIKDPARLCAIVRAMKAAVKLPVTVKTRIGSAPGQCAIQELARRIEDAGADGLALHARYTSERHSGPADWTVIADVKAKLRIPVIGNGGITTAEQAVEFYRRYGVDGVMIGRAAMGNPWIFQHIRAILAGAPWRPPTCAERRAVMADHLAMTVDGMTRQLAAKRKKKSNADTAGARLFRAHLVKYMAGMDGVTDMKRGMNDLWSSEDVMRAIDAVLSRNPDGSL